MQVTLPSYLRADFDKYFGTGALPASTAPAPAQPAAPAAVPAAGAGAAADMRGTLPVDGAPMPTAADSTAASGSGGTGGPQRKQQMHATGGDGGDAMLAVPRLYTASQDVCGSGNQSPRPAEAPDSPRAVGAARVALDFMDADGSPPHQQAADDASDDASGAATACDISSGHAAVGQRVAHAERHQAATLEQAAAAPPGVDLVFEAAGPAAHKAHRTDDSSSSMQEMRHSPAASRGRESGAALAAVAVSAGAATESSLPAAAAAAAGVAGAAAVAAVAAPVVPVFRSRIGRMRLPTPPPQEDDALDQSDMDMPSGKWLAVLKSGRSFLTTASCLSVSVSAGAQMLACECRGRHCG